jgi:hypothetical protein
MNHYTENIHDKSGDNENGSEGNSIKTKNFGIENIGIIGASA